MMPCWERHHCETRHYFLSFRTANTVHKVLIVVLKSSLSQHFIVDCSNLNSSQHVLHRGCSYVIATVLLIHQSWSLPTAMNLRHTLITYKAIFLEGKGTASYKIVTRLQGSALAISYLLKQSMLSCR